MQREISDEAAIHFARKLYRSLATGSPVDAAVAEARKAVSLALPTSVEWATPVLHMRSPDGILFDLKGTTKSAVAIPSLQAEPTMVDFGQVDEGKTPVIPVAVKNVGGGTLSWSFKTTENFLVASRTDEGLSLTLQAHPGTHRGTVLISSNGGETTIDVRAEIIAKPLAQAQGAEVRQSEKPRSLRAVAGWIVGAIVALALLARIFGGQSQQDRATRSQEIRDSMAGMQMAPASDSMIHDTSR
jgi:hypothetical protein